MNCFLESDQKSYWLEFSFPVIQPLMGHHFSPLEGSLEEGQEDGKVEEQGKSQFFYSSPLRNYICSFLVPFCSLPTHTMVKKCI